MTEEPREALRAGPGAQAGDCAGQPVEEAAVTRDIFHPRLDCPGVLQPLTLEASLPEATRAIVLTIGWWP